jgi:pyruvate kinase
LFVKGVVELAEDLNARLVVFSIHGNTARIASGLRPSIPVFVGSPNPKVLRKLSILWSLQPIYVDAQSYDEGLQKSIEKALQLGYIEYGDLVVATYGLKEPRQRIEVLRVVG